MGDDLDDGGERTASTRTQAPHHAPTAAPSPLVGAASIAAALIALMVVGAGVFALAMKLSSSHGTDEDFGIGRFQDGLQTRNLEPARRPQPRAREQRSRRALPDDPLSRRIWTIWSADDGTVPSFSGRAADGTLSSSSDVRACRYPDVTTCIARCEAGHAPSCHRFAEDTLFGPAERRHVERGVELLVGLCASGRLPSCLLLGTWLETLTPPKEPDGPVLAARLWDYLCGERVGVGCLRSARLLERQGDPVDRRAAGTAFESACRMGDAAGCLDAARWWRESMGPQSTEQVSRFKESARLMASLGCTVSRRPEDCLTLARAARDEGGSAAARAHLAQARLLLTPLCDGGDPEACHTLGATFVAPGEGAARGAPVLEQACIGGVARACHLLGDVLLKGQGSIPGQGGSPAATARASQLHERGCRLGEGRSCQAVADILEREGSGDADTIKRYRAVGALLGPRSLDGLHSGDHSQ